MERGEIFGLLGLNGAGKSTTFNILTGEVPLTEGQVVLDGMDLSVAYRKPHKLFQIVGYCPQTNALEDDFSVLESLRLVCHLVGV